MRHKRVLLKPHPKKTPHLPKNQNRTYHYQVNNHKWHFITLFLLIKQIGNVESGIVGTTVLQVNQPDSAGNRHHLYGRLLGKAWYSVSWCNRSEVRIRGKNDWLKWFFIGWRDMPPAGVNRVKKPFCVCPHHVGRHGIIVGEDNRTWTVAEAGFHQINLNRISFTFDEKQFVCNTIFHKVRAIKGSSNMLFLPYCIENYKNMSKPRPLCRAVLWKADQVVLY